MLVVCRLKRPIDKVVYVLLPLDVGCVPRRANTPYVRDLARSTCRIADLTNPVGNGGAQCTIWPSGNIGSFKSMRITAKRGRDNRDSILKRSGPPGNCGEFVCWA